MTILIETPFEFFTDNDGDALENGKIYIGTENRDPETNAISIYWDKALTIAAEQPVRTLSGKPAYNGSPGNLYITESNFSITVRDKNDVLVETLLSAGDISSSSSSSGSGVTPNNRVISGAVRDNSEQPAFLSIDGGNPNVTILGDTTALSLAINGTIVGVETDIVETGLTTASGSNNTCLVNDSSLTDQASSKYTGEDNSTLTIDAAGSEITSRVGQTAAFQKNGSTELMLAYIKSATQLTNIRRGWFYDEDGDPIVRETLADDDQLNILSLGWIFMLNDGGTVDVTYNSPTYSYTAPTSPTAGDYWFDIDADVWKQYTTVWVQSNNTLIGAVAVGTTLTEGKREIDYFHDYRDTNTMSLEVFSDEVIRTIDKTANIFAYSKTLRIDPFKTVWNNTLDMETGSIGNSTKYYLYIDESGETFISTEKYYDRNDLRGKYHPYEAWRFIGTGTTDGTADWESSTDEQTQKTGVVALVDGADVATNCLLGNVFTLSPAKTETTSGSLVVGDSYYLYDWITADDFTNVGAASNADGVEFIATGTTPTTWTNSSKVWRMPIISNPTNLKIGEEYTWIITQPVTGNVRIYWDTYFDFSGYDRVNLAANAVTIITGKVVSATSIKCQVSIDSKQIAKAWINFNGIGTIAINGSYNVSSITDLGTGHYRITFLVPFANDDYCVSGSSQGANLLTSNSLTALKCDVYSNIYSGAAEDQPVICVSFFGDQ